MPLAGRGLIRLVVPESAPEIFAGVDTTSERLRRLVEEIDGFYARGALRLALASRDRDLVPELDQLLGAVEAGVAAMVREALKTAGPSERTVEVANALMSFPVWASFNRLGLTAAEMTRLRTSLLEWSLNAASVT